MRYIFCLLIVVHGLIHLMGFAKAFGFAELSALTQPVSRVAGLFWMLGALAFGIAGTLFLFRQASWWWVALIGMAVSQTLIILTWRDARFGTIANLIIVLPVIAASLEARPASYGNQYTSAVREGLASFRKLPVVTEEDLSHLPEPVRNYLRFAGAVGQPRIHHFHAVFTGDFRNGFNGPWMKFRSEQYNFFDPPARLFQMQAAMYGLPMEGLHMFRGDAATMRIKLASLFQVVDAKGPEMNQGETVTLFNDMCVLAPASLIDKEKIQWETDGPLAARAKFTNLGVTIRARLTFGPSGELIDFVSNDRFLSSDGKTFLSYPWSTPLRDYRDFGGRRVAGYGEAVWQTAEGPFTYGKFNLARIEYNSVTGSGDPSAAPRTADTVGQR